MKRRNDLLQMKNIHLAYGQVQALKGVDFDLYRGEIHAIIGEHRAGKSSLVRILSGDVAKQHGSIVYCRKEYNAFTPKSAIRNGIGIVYQDLQIIPQLSAVENVFAGRMLRNAFGALHKDLMFERCRSLFAMLRMDFDLEISASQLTIAEQCMICVARCLLNDPSVLILDEINQILTPGEMRTIYDLILARKADGKSIIYISDDMDEVLRLADRVTVLKNGFRRGTEITKDLDKYKLFQLTYSYAVKKQKSEYDRMSSYMADRFFTNLIQALPLGIIVVDTSNRIRIINQRTLDIVDKNPDMMKNRFLHQVLEDVQLERRREIMGKLSARQPGTWEELRIAGDRRVSIHVFPNQDEGNVVFGSTILIGDISLESHIEEYLIMSEKMSSIAEVATGVAHEINNPLCSIRNYLSLIEKEGLQQKSKTRLELVEREIDRIVSIVRGLLSFSRREDFMTANVDIHKVVNDVALLLTHQVAEKHIDLTVEVHGEDLSIFGEENKIKQLLINLLINSIDAVLLDGKISIHVSDLADDGFVEIRVRDNGYGIPRDVQGKIFEPFFSSKMNRKNTGLGLSICRHIVDQHEGIISFESVPGKETIFTVRLPRTRVLRAQ